MKRKDYYLDAIKTIALKYSCDLNFDSISYFSQVIATSYSLKIVMVQNHLCCAINRIAFCR